MLSVIPVRSVLDWTVSLAAASPRLKKKNLTYGHTTVTEKVMI